MVDRKDTGRQSIILTCETVKIITMGIIEIMFSNQHNFYPAGVLKFCPRCVNMAFIVLVRHRRVLLYKRRIKKHCSPQQWFADMDGPHMTV